MYQVVRNWLGRRWQPAAQRELLQDYHSTFATPAGQRVLQHLLDNVYCRVYEGTDPHAAAILNARRSVVQEILENIDLAKPTQRDITVEKGEGVTNG